MKINPLIRQISHHFLSPFQHSYTSISINNHHLSLSKKILNLINYKQLKASQIKQLLTQLIISGRLKNPFFGSKFLRLLSQVGTDLGSTLWGFNRIIFPDIVCFNTLIKVYSCGVVPFDGVKVYFGMIKCGVFPNCFTFPPLLSCCAKIGDVGVSELCHGQVIKSGFDNVLEVCNSMIHMYACCGVIEVAVKVFHEMVERDLVSWNSIVDGYVKVGYLRSAHKVFDVMPERNVVSWNVLMTGYLDYNPGCVLKLFREMIGTGLKGNDTSFVNVIAACGRSARRREGASVHGYFVRRLWCLSLIMNTALIDMYSKCGKVGVARSIFDGMLERNVVCWNSMILGHCLHGNPEDGLRLFEDMIRCMKVDDFVAHGYVNVGARPRMLPDEITFVGVLCACTRAGFLEEGKTFWVEMTDYFGIKPNFAHYWCMANLLASKGLVQEALEFVRKVDEFVEDMSSESLLWASLLGSCRIQGDSSVAEHVAKALIDLEPQNVMCYALLLNIYAAAGRWEDVIEVKKLMKMRTNSNSRGCSLVDLIDIVHNFRLEDETWRAPVIVKMVVELTQKFSPSDAHIELPSVPET